MQKPLISIIIPTYNRAHVIEETLDSIRLQTYTNWECIIVDDGSTDSSLEIISAYCKKDKRFQFFQRPKNRKKGANTCRNLGFELSIGEFINWFDSDDIMSLTFLEEAMFLMSKNKKIDFVLFDYCSFRSNDITNINLVQKNYTKNLIEDYATWKINFGTWAIVWKRELVNKYSFNIDLTRAQDLDFNLRIFFNEPITFKNTNTIGVYQREHENSLTSDFNKKKLKSLISEITVRKYLIRNLIDLKTNKSVINNSIKILNISFVKLFRSKYYTVFLKEVIDFINLKEFNCKKIFWFFKTLFLLLTIIIIKKGDIKLKKHLLTIPVNK